MGLGSLRCASTQIRWITASSSALFTEKVSPSMTVGSVSDTIALRQTDPTAITMRPKASIISGRVWPVLKVLLAASVRHIPDGALSVRIERSTSGPLHRSSWPISWLPIPGPGMR